LSKLLIRGGSEHFLQVLLLHFLSREWRSAQRASINEFDGHFTISCLPLVLDIRRKKGGHKL